MKKSKKLIKPVTPKPPVVKKAKKLPVKNYDVKVQKGKFAEFHEAYRIIVDDLAVQDGFGNTPAEALNDFIQRNNSDILNKIFDVDK